MMNKKNSGIWMMAFLFLFTTSFQKKEIFKKSPFAIVKITFNNAVKNYKIAFHDSVYINPFGEKYTITKFRYYVSNISLKTRSKNFSEKNSYHLFRPTPYSSLR